MYHAMVRRRVRRLYAALNAADPRPLVDSLGPSFAYTFVGSGHPLAGTRRNLPDMRAQMDRVLRLFPGLRFHVLDVVVTGRPWDTRIAIVMEVDARLADGDPYHNDLVQLLWLRWGRAVQVRTVIDTARLTAACRRLAAVGILEATAPPVS
jgi:ketosteroid isomerase-like protein